MNPEPITINGDKFVPATAIVKNKSYRFDKSTASISATATQYDISKGWTFTLDDGSGMEVLYSSDELRGRMESGSLWRKLGS